MVRSGSGLEWVGVAAGTKSWLANEQKGGRSSPVNSRIQDRKTDTVWQSAAGGTGTVSMQEQNSDGKTYPGSAQVAMSLSQQAHSRRTISCAERRDTSPGKWLGQKQQQEESRHHPPNNTCQGAAAAPCLQACCRALKRLSVQREAALGDPVIPSEQAEKTLTRSRPKRATGGPLAHLTAGGLPGNDSGNNSG